MGKRNARKTGYVPKKLVYQTFRRLGDYVLPHQFFVDGSELGLRFLREHAENSADGAAAFLDAQRRRLRIPSTGFKFDEISTRAAQAYITLGCHTAEQFLTEFAGEYKRLKQISEWIDRDGKKQLSALDAILANMKSSTTVVRAMPEYHVLKYYSAVRNALVHGLSRAKADRLHEVLIADHGEYFTKWYSKLAAPNPTAKLRYDDHQFLILVLGKFAACLNDECDLSIADVLAMSTSEPDSMRTLVRSRADDEKLGGYVAYLRHRYSFSAADATWLRSEFMKYLNGIPTHRERKRATYRGR